MKPFETQAIVSRTPSGTLLAFRYVLGLVVMFFVFALRPTWQHTTYCLACGAILWGVETALSRRRRVTVRVDARGIAVNGKPVIARKAIRSAFLLPGSEHGVRVVTPNFTTDVRAKSGERADRLLESLSLDVASATARFDVYCGTAAPFWSRGLLGAATVPMALGALDPSRLPYVVAASLPLALVAAWRMVRVKATLVVGADGLLLARIGTKEFVRYQDLVKVEEDKRHPVLVLVRRTGRPLELWVGAVDDESPIARRALAKRIEDARAAAPTAQGCRAEIGDLLAPGERGVDAWLSGLRKLARGTGYRDAAVSSDQLWAIVSDPTKGASARAGAAFALRSNLDGEGRERLRVVAQACAEPKLRVALDAAAGEEEEALEDAYRPLAGAP